MDKQKMDMLKGAFSHLEDVGKEVGFKDLTPLHGEWIHEMVFGEGDYTLQAHCGSYKSSCLAVAIALILLMTPNKNIIFIRKTDNDVSEMLGMVAKIRHLGSPVRESRTPGSVGGRSRKGPVYPTFYETRVDLKSGRPKNGHGARKINGWSENG